MKMFKKDYIENSIEINKSKFICIVTKIFSKEEFNSFYNSIKNKYPKATHYVPVYRIFNGKNINYYYSDDNEPPKTAGFPIYNIIEKNDIVNIGICVVRYFGGIKLGTGGLQKAYSKVFLDILNKEEFVDYKKTIKTTIEIFVNQFDLAEKYLKRLNVKIIDKKFDKNTLKFILDIEFEEDKGEEIINFFNKFNISFNL